MYIDNRASRTLQSCRWHGKVDDTEGRRSSSVEMDRASKTPIEFLFLMTHAWELLYNQSSGIAAVFVSFSSTHLVCYSEM